MCKKICIIVVLLAFIVTASLPALAVEKINLVLWLGGEWEIPGLYDWFKEAVKIYEEENPKVSVELVNLSTDTYLAQFAAAGEARTGPDLIFTWPAIWCLEHVWKDYLAPVDEYFTDEEKKNFMGFDQRLWDKKHWGVGFYVAGKPMMYNKKIFKKAGLDPEHPPLTWAQLLEAGEKLKQAGYIPIGFGASDWGGGYLVGNLACQTMDNPLPMLQMSVGDKKFTDPEFSLMWEKIYELYKRGYFPENADSLNLWQGWEMFEKGECGIDFICDVQISRIVDILGEDAVGIAKPPIYGQGEQAGKYVLEVQALSITSWSRCKKEAANFLRFLHTEKMLNKFYDGLGIIPPDYKFDPGRIRLPQLKKMWKFIQEGTADWMENFYPTMVDEQGVFAGCQLLFAGEIDGKGVAKMAEEIAKKWRMMNPDEVTKYREWMEEFK